MTDASGFASGVRREIETIVRGQVERLLSAMDVVSREEHDAVKTMAALARDEERPGWSGAFSLSNRSSAPPRPRRPARTAICQFRPASQPTPGVGYRRGALRHPASTRRPGPPWLRGGARVRMYSV